MKFYIAFETAERGVVRSFPMNVPDLEEAIAEELYLQPDAVVVVRPYPNEQDLKGGREK